jgi:hypothetical protein
MERKDDRHMNARFDFRRNAPDAYKAMGGLELSVPSAQCRAHSGALDTEVLERSF